MKIKHLEVGLNLKHVGLTKAFNTNIIRIEKRFSFQLNYILTTKNTFFNMDIFLQINLKIN